MTEVKVPVESIRVDGRYRRDLGDVDSLARSINREGLIHAITITPDRRLIAGARRLAAVRTLGWTHIDARVVDNLDDATARLRMERDENTERKAMAPSELVALGLELERLERPGSAERRRLGALMGAARRHGRDPDPALSPAGGKAGSTDEIVAEALGIGATTYHRAKTVVSAAADTALPDDDRRIAQEALADMDATGMVAPSFDRVRQHIGTRTRTGARERTLIETAPAQRRAISSAETALSGICHGLAQIEALHPDITSEEATRWVGSLFRSRRVITAVINQLKERSNAQPA